MARAYDEEDHPLSECGIEQRNHALLRRYREFRRGADAVAAAWRAHPEVIAVALIGSVARAPWKEAPRFGAYGQHNAPVFCVYRVTMSRRPVLPDLLHPGLDLVICGMAAGSRSAETGTYYAHGSNKFWRVLKETGLTPRRLAPGEFASLAEFGIGLTDLAKYASGADSGLGRGDIDVARFRDKILTMRPRVLAFNGKNAAKVALERRSVNYGRQSNRIGETVVYLLPSTSGSASGFWDTRPWHDCAKLVLVENLAKA